MSEHLLHLQHFQVIGYHQENTLLAMELDDVYQSESGSDSDEEVSK